MSEGDSQADDESGRHLVVSLVGVDDSKHNDDQHEAQEELDAESLGDGQIVLQSCVAQSALVLFRSQRL